jgi:hypothetical protein
MHAADWTKKLLDKLIKLGTNCYSSFGKLKVWSTTGQMFCVAPARPLILSITHSWLLGISTNAFLPHIFQCLFFLQLKQSAHTSVLESLVQQMADIHQFGSLKAPRGMTDKVIPSFMQNSLLSTLVLCLSSLGRPTFQLNICSTTIFTNYTSMSIYTYTNHITYTCHASFCCAAFLSPIWFD